MGPYATALAAYRAGLATAERLAATDPSNLDWQRDLSISHNRIGDVMALAGRREEALAEYQASLAICENLAAADPANVLWQTDLVIGLVRLGTNGDEPRPRLTRALEIVRRLEQAGKLTAAHQGWIKLIEQALAKLPA